MDVAIEGLCVQFGKVVVLDGFDAEFMAGRVTALVGPSGSGKSTILAAIAGFLKPDAGRIFLREDDNSYGPRPDKVGWISQGANALGTRTVHDNVMLGALADGIDLATASSRADSAIDRVGLSHRSKSAARTLSGGELQRVAFARALASRRPLVLADEPTASLDAAATANIIDLLRGLRSTATVIVATHDPSVIAAAQDVVNVRSLEASNA